MEGVISVISVIRQKLDLSIFKTPTLAKFAAFIIHCTNDAVSQTQTLEGMGGWRGTGSHNIYDK